MHVISYTQYESVLLITVLPSTKTRLNFATISFFSLSFLCLVLLLFFLRGPGWGPLLTVCESTLNLLCKAGSLVYIFLNFTCWQILMLKSPDLRLVLHYTLIDLFVCLISDRRNGTGKQTQKQAHMYLDT